LDAAQDEVKEGEITDTDRRNELTARDEELS